MKLKPKIILFIFLGLVLILAFLRLLSPEDCWIKDKNGNWVKHGNPSGPAPTEQTTKLGNSDWWQEGMVVATFVLAVATGFLAWFTYKIVKENKALREQDERQFIISKSPALQLIEGKEEINLKEDKTNPSEDAITFRVKNIGFAPAFEINILRCSRGDKGYTVELPGDRRSFDLSVRQKTNFPIKLKTSHNLNNEDLEKPITIETQYDGLLKNNIKQHFEFPGRIGKATMMSLGVARTTYLHFGV